MASIRSGGKGRRNPGLPFEEGIPSSGRTPRPARVAELVSKAHTTALTVKVEIEAAIDAAFAGANGEPMLRTYATHAQPSYGIRPQHRLLDETHVGRVTLQVSDLQRSVEYHPDALGMSVLDRQDNVARLGVGATGQQLTALQGETGVLRRPRAGRFGLYHFAVLLPYSCYPGRFAAHLFSSGVRFGMADHSAPAKRWTLMHPDGLGIEVYADRPRSSWTQRRKRTGDGDRTARHRRRDRSLGKARPGRQMPGGTVMGHIHLHVGDINGAEAFYHATLGFDKTVWSYPGGTLFVGRRLPPSRRHEHLVARTFGRRGLGAAPRMGADCSERRRSGAGRAQSGRGWERDDRRGKFVDDSGPVGNSGEDRR